MKKVNKLNVSIFMVFIFIALNIFTIKTFAQSVPTTPADGIISGDLYYIVSSTAENTWM